MQIVRATLAGSNNYLKVMKGEIKMAKKNLLKLALVIALSMAATSAYSATTISVSTALGGSSFSCSNKVDIGIATDGTNTQFDGTAYSARSKHFSGDKVIATMSGDSKLYWKTRAVGSSVDAAATNDTFTATATWTSM
jgi:hypothetical protein